MNSNKLQLQGYVREYIDGQLIIEHPNAIRNPLKTLFGEWMRGVNTDKNISTLFDAAGVQVGGAQDTNDGICLRDANVAGDNFFSMTTTMENSNYNTFGVQWKGVLTASQDRSVDFIYLGNSFTVAGAPFDNLFASIDKSGAPVSLVTNQTYEITWGIYPS